MQLDAARKYKNPNKMQSDESEKEKIPKNKQLDAECVYKMFDSEVMPVTLHVSPSKSYIGTVQKIHENTKKAVRCYRKLQKYKKKQLYANSINDLSEFEVLPVTFQIQTIPV